MNEDPLIHPAGANAKTDEHCIYVNEAGAKYLIDMLNAYLRTGKIVSGLVRENQGSVKFCIIPSTQADFDCGGNQ